MNPGKYNMVCPQGTTFNKQLTYTINSVPVDLTTYAARMQVREQHTSTATIVNINTENGGIVLGGEDGTISLNIPASDTALIFDKTYVYDLELVNGEEVQRIIEGKFIVTPEVTK